MSRLVTHSFLLSRKTTSFPGSYLFPGGRDWSLGMTWTACGYFGSGKSNSGLSSLKKSKKNWVKYLVRIDRDFIISSKCCNSFYLRQILKALVVCCLRSTSCMLIGSLVCTPWVHTVQWRFKNHRFSKNFVFCLCFEGSPS